MSASGAVTRSQSGAQPRTKKESVQTPVRTYTPRAPRSRGGSSKAEPDRTPSTPVCKPTHTSSPLRSSTPGALRGGSRGGSRGGAQARAKKEPVVQSPARTTTFRAQSSRGGRAQPNAGRTPVVPASQANPPYAGQPRGGARAVVGKEAVALATERTPQAANNKRGKGRNMKKGKMSDTEDQDGAQPVPGGHRVNPHVHADLAPIMNMFTTSIGQLVQAMQRQTFTLADRHQREQEGLIARLEEAMRQQQADFMERQEASFRQQREALEALVRNVTAERPRDIFREVPTFSGNPDEFTVWLAAVYRVREARQVADAVAIAECSAKLVGSAREWHERIGVNQDTWAG